MKKHKSKALEYSCLCDGCEFRFQCFTQERVFTNPIYQGLFEALMAQGRTKEEAIDEVTQEIKSRMGNDVYSPITVSPLFPWLTGGVTISQPYVDNGLSIVDISYTLHTGEEICWSADVNSSP